MKILYEYNVRVPEYALPYLINGDNSNLTKDDIITINNWLKYYQDKSIVLKGAVSINLVNDNSYFSKHPTFGLPCTCIDCVILILV